MLGGGKKITERGGEPPDVAMEKKSNLEADPEGLSILKKKRVLCG